MKPYELKYESPFDDSALDYYAEKFIKSDVQEWGYVPRTFYNYYEMVTGYHQTCVYYIWAKKRDDLLSKCKGQVI